MKDNSGSTHREHAVDPRTFRAAATGIGQQFSHSVITGGMRAQRVVDSVPAECMAPVPDNEGYPPRTPETYTLTVAGVRGR